MNAAALRTNLSRDALSLDHRRRACAELVAQRTGLQVPEFRWSLFARELDRLGGGLPPTPAELAANEAILLALARLLAVSESYLFRHPGHFTALEAFARRRRREGRGCRVLSAGCATGEEAWSAAAMLHDVYQSGGATVVGWDLDAERLRRARDGVYRSWSMRGGLHGKDHCFEPMRRFGEDAIGVAEGLRRFVEFRAVNLAGELPQGPLFDVLIFRNVSIYWSVETTGRIFDKLVNHLSADALLLLGPSDPLRPGDGWRRDPDAEVPVYTRSTGASAAMAPRTPTPDPVRERRRAPSLRPKSARHLSKSRRPRAKASVAVPSCSPPARTVDAAGGFGDVEAAAVARLDAEVARAWRLADLGSYASAEEILEGLAEEGAVSARGQTLRGVLALHFGRCDDALRFLREAVYFAPGDVQARRWLALAHDAAGRHDEAQRERRNADRLETGPAG